MSRAPRLAALVLASLVGVVGVVGACADEDPVGLGASTSGRPESAATFPPTSVVAAVASTSPATTSASSSAPGPASSQASVPPAAAATTATSPPTVAESTVAPTIAGSTVAPTVGSTSAATAGRPYDVYVPAGYDGSNARPLVVLLHGWGGSGTDIDRYFQLREHADRLGFLYVSPDGTVDRRGRQFWNATDGCCNVDDLPVDDSAYLAAMIAEIATAYRVDPARVYVMGLSNGGYMAYRMACDHAGLIAAVVSFAGATFLEASRCVPSEPVSVLEVHGTADVAVPYDGGRLRAAEIPSAPGTVALWAGYNGCSGDRVVTAVTLDLDAGQAGADTEVSRFEGCPQDGAVELWTVIDGPHVYDLGADAVRGVLDFLFGHPDA